MLLWMDDGKTKEKIILPDDQLDDYYLDSGEEGTIYQYCGYALKVYHEKSRKARLSEEDCKKMRKIETFFVQMPHGILYDGKLSFKGYGTFFVKSRCLDEIMALKMGAFNEKVKEIYEELGILSDHRVSVYDFHLGNFCYDGDFNFVDPGSYEFEEEEDKKSVLLRNQIEFSDFVVKDLLTLPILSHKRKCKKLKDHFDGIDYLPDIFEDEADENETVKKYVKRILQ